ncbi:TnsA endonuclease N-terminal domain-containing protein [Aureimonas sp. Leaf324]|uniref:TnsA endonuclease N-terminal domain-containing protein n=1 Tax=Aureimonas sp. Leaf324 TaxID=1736336 RepID=UPI0006FC8925|nr:TnsA endonuclease N-terminal domain-containing protein [Aureimonas sp. Leaf324]KQQ80544.1 hypothetical protein ASF65_09940 [Aureimonas sp. Leaf324]
MLESAAEHRIRLVLKARPDVAKIQEQPTPITYVDSEGKPRQRTVDFLVTLTSGEQIAVEVKASVRVTEKLRNEIACIADQMSPSYASGVILLTETSTPRAIVTDALLFASVKRDADYDAYRALTDVARGLASPISIRDLGARLKRPTSGFRAVVRLIAEGVLERVESVPLSLDTLVRAMPIDDATGGTP